MITADEVRRLALTFPEAYEADHHGFPSFRLGTKIFATLPDDDHLHAMVGEDEIRSLAAAQPATYEEKWWDKRLACLRVDLRRVDPAEVAELLADAWSRKAPRRLSGRSPHSD